MGILLTLYDTTKNLYEAGGHVTSVSAALNAFIQSNHDMRERMLQDFPSLIERLHKADRCIQSSLDDIANETKVERGA